MSSILYEMKTYLKWPQVMVKILISLFNFLFYLFFFKAPIFTNRTPFPYNDHHNHHRHHRHQRHFHHFDEHRERREQSFL